MGTKDRFLEFISYKGLSKRRFQYNIGVSNSYIQNMSNSIGQDVLNRINAVYPELNTDWLLTGEGEMLNTSVPSYHISQANSDRNSTSVAGNGNNVNATSALERAMEALIEQQRMTTKAQDSLLEQQKITQKTQEQMDRLIFLLENK